MSRQHRLGMIVSLALALVIGACGTKSSTPTPAPAAGTTPGATTSASSSASFIQHPTQLLINGLQQAPTGSTVSDYGIYSIDSDGANLKRLDPEGNADYFPSWSPDGKQVTYTRFLTPMDGSVTPRAVIIAMNVDGTNSRTLTDSAGLSLNSVWSPDGKQIAFERVVDPSLTQDQWDTVVAVMDTDGSNVKVLGHGFLIGAPSWSPDSSQITFTGPDQAAPGSAAQGKLFVYVVRTNGKDLEHIYGPGQVISPRWSPDESLITFVEITQGGDQQGTIAAIGVVRSNGSDPRILTDQQFRRAFFPEWSPDGRQIVFVGGQSGSMATPTVTPGDMTTGIYVMNADGSDPQRIAEGLSHNTGAMVTAPAWSPDGSGIAYLAMPLTSGTPDSSATSLVGAELRLASPDGMQHATILTGFFVEPVFDPFDSMGSPAPVWRPTGK